MNVKFQIWRSKCHVGKKKPQSQANAVCKQRLTNSDGINSVIFSKLLLAECIVNAKGLLKLILHFFNVLIISTNFWVLYRTINIRHICSLYHSLVHSSTPQQPMTPSLCGSSTHHPRILISHSFVFVQLPVHLFNHIETWVVLSAWLVTKKEK